ncbi:Ubiquitin carboxyl-terminal hydrolase 20 [Orchesella cincta]|uniref:Ubiquitin carboxyl-terminal hydrolase n=1 Tax=Orchesella cincta TaxID=48709 RepID=A0A1D2M389_ORCCI|nr:Ubiquitin carboxyl-terminal hydrolase 20 [Orchesella cincta]
MKTMAMAATDVTLFCPHLSFKVAHTRNGDSHRGGSERKNCIVDQDDLDGNKSNVNSEGDERTSESSENVDRVCNEEAAAESHISCHDCNELGVNIPPRSPYHLWRCLEPKCKLLLCGKQLADHSQSHCQDYPTHVLQENAASKRIWCNDCNHEVFPDHRNRRTAPGIWTPGYRIEEEIPRGLYNIGNTCFMNAALQCMLAVTPLTSYMLGQCSNLQGKHVALSYLWLLSEMWCDDPYKYQKGVMPSRLLHSVRATHPIFRGFQQHDTQEFLRLFMDTLADETRVPHFIFDDTEETKGDVRDSEDGGSSDSETESFETCDSGNASEETMSTDVQNGDGGSASNNPLKDVKVVLKSIVSEIFDGQIESSAQCLSCKQVSSRIEVFQDLSLPIPTREELIAIKKYEKFEQDEFRRSVGWFEWIWDWMKSFMWGPAPTLEDCFAAFFSSDELKGKNMYSCEKCKKLRNGVKRCSLYGLPEVLCVHLKRFRMYEYSGGMGFSGKLSQYVQFPMDSLDLHPFLNKDCASEVTTYRLLGIICHIGSFLGGHYISYVRRGEQWYLCDDARVVPVSAETVSQSEAYVLFYQKYAEEDDDTKQAVLGTWSQCETNPAKGAGGDGKFHILSRKWLTQFFWSEEVGPIDNSDVICPHGFIIPYEYAHYGATWVPQPVWQSLMDRYGGGPSLAYTEECVVCAAAWRKHLKATSKSSASLDSSSERD